MKIAIKRDATIVNDSGRVIGHDAGATLVRRFIRLFPGVQLIGTDPRHCHGFDMVPLEFVDPDDTIIINMDVLDSMDVWNRIYRESAGVEPKIMNFLWWPTTQLTHQVEQASLALSCALFPTFANSERTAAEIHDLVRKQTVKALSGKSQLAWVNLGFRLEHIKDRQMTEIPIVLYPAIRLSDRKRPHLFKSVVERVRERTPLEVEMRLQESSLLSERAMAFSQLDWVSVGPLIAERSAYWEALSHTTAFLATAEEESYGLTYVEAMGAGTIGVFPDRPWARALVPKGYPFLYRSESEADEMLYKAISDPEACHAILNTLTGGSFKEWISSNHSDAIFDSELIECINAWFGE